MTTIKIAIVAWGGLIAIEGLPLPEPLDLFAKYGNAGLAMFIVWWLVAKTIPSMNREHSESNASLVDKMDELKDEMKNASDRQCQLLEAALRRTYEHD